ncbi:MAG TPA: hypothetical protein VFU45_02965, partial [Gemmatimonadales bacterium]|nr:hypothetical protein [Gemmatimonadales bacterium]
YQRLVPVRATLRVRSDRDTFDGSVTITPGVVRISGPVAAVKRVDGVPTVPFDLPPGADPAGLTVALDTARLPGLRVTPGDVTIRVRPPTP